MSSVAELRLPGVTFEAASPALADALPRMDVAAFVGYAAVGPLDIPVAVGDPVSFRDIYGQDLELARDPATGASQYSYLGQAVEAFFRNGGRRCRVVRVAGDGSTASTFALANLVAIGGDNSATSWQLGTVTARSQGSWADHLRVGTVLDANALQATGFDATGVTLGASAEVRSGDVLRLSFSGGITALARVAANVEDGPNRIVSWSDSSDETGNIWWFSSTPPESLPSEPIAVHRLVHDGQETISFVALDTPWSSGMVTDPPTDNVLLAIDDTETLDPGDVLRVDYGLTDGDGRPAFPLLLSVLEQVTPSDTQNSLPDGGSLAESPATGVWFSARICGFVQPERPAAIDSQDPSGAVPLVERLDLELVVWEDDALTARLGGLAFTAGDEDDDRSRNWAQLPDDLALFSRLANLPSAGDDGDRQASGITVGNRLSTLWESARFPRFPLAGPTDASGNYIPLGMATAPLRNRARPAASAVDTDSRMERNGLERHEAGHFLDDRVVDASVRTLLQRGHYLQYVAPSRHALRGIHSLLPVDEVTLLAVPDAVHPGWDLRSPERHAPVEPPHLGAPQAVGEDHQICWSIVADATVYELERSTDTTFETGSSRTRHDVGPEQSQPSGEFCAPVDDLGDCPNMYFFRVRAERRGESGPWSNTVRSVLPRQAFDDCAQPSKPPVLSFTDLVEPAARRLTWDASGPGEQTELQSSPDPIFSGSPRSNVTDSDSYVVGAPVDRMSHHRVRHHRTDDNGNEVDGPWSNTVSYPAAPAPEWITRTADPTELAHDLSAIQLSTLRMCAARADLFAVLSLPGNAREDTALAHAASLRSLEFEVASGGGGFDDTRTRFALGVTRLSAGEEHALTYGAIYHPWPTARINRSAGARVESQPPDGALTGLIAQRTIARGAWIAAAHQPIDGVLALSPPLADAARSRLLAGQVNALDVDPRGFHTIGSETLSRDASLREISVRRLMILLRRLVLRHGATYVFRPNDAAFRSMVRVRLEQVLLGLYQRGAFAGTTPAEAFRVTTDESVNPIGNVELGRFIVEIAVAPSQPLKFIRVRLVQSGPGAVDLEEV